MRQLVSVVTDDAVLYFVDDGEATTQIAQIIHTGLDVSDVVRLGTNLCDALQLNGVQTAVATAVAKRVPLGPAPKAMIDSGSGSRPAKSSKWMQRVVCPEPGCEYSSKRSNLSTHLQTQQHGYSKHRANLAANEARTVESMAETPEPKPMPTKRAKQPPSAPRGVAGARHIAGTVAPMFKAYAETVPFITSRACADHFHMDPSRCRKVITRLVEIGDLIDVTPPDSSGNAARQYATTAQINAQRRDVFAEARASIALDDGQTQS